MITCVNCSADADYSYPMSLDNVVHYCGDHLPKFLYGRRNSGDLKLILPAPVEEPAKSSKKKTTEPVEVDEPVVEEPTVEEPAEEPVTE